MHRLLLVLTASAALVGCGEPGRPLGLSVGGGDVDLAEARSTWEAGTLTLLLVEDPNPRRTDDERRYQLRIDLREPGGLDGETLDVSGTAVVEEWDFEPLGVGFIRDETRTSPSVDRAYGWRTVFLPPDVAVPFSESIEGTLDIYEVDSSVIRGEIDVTVQPMIGLDDETAVRFHGRFDSR